MNRITVTVFIGLFALLAASCSSGEVGSAGRVTLAPTETSSTTPATTTTSSTEPGTVGTVTTQATTNGEPADQLFVQLFFIKDGQTAAPVVRAVDTPAVAANAIRALISGPTAAEQDSELSTAIPADTLLLGLTIEDGLATIDLSREFEVGGGSFNILSRLAQVVYTLTQFETVDEVLFHLDGQPVSVFSGEGVVLDSPVDRSDYATILPTAPNPDVAADEPWSQADLPDIAGVDPTWLSRVALVADDDVLNVRQDPTVEAPIVGMLLPGVVVERTGLEEISGSSIWVQLVTPVGDFWANSWFLSAVVSHDDFAADPRIAELLEEFAELITEDGDLRSVTSRRGLYVAHNAGPVRFAPDELATILTDPTTYHWPSNAVGPDQLDEIPARTFSEAVTDSFLSAYDDPDTRTTVNEPIEAGNSRLPEYAIPFEFESFNYIGVHDPGDNPEYGGLDWSTWYVSIDYEDGEPVIVGLTVDMWAP